MSKTTADLEDELLNPDPTPFPEPPDGDPTDVDHLWSGRSGKVALAYPIIRNHVVIGPGEECPVCLRRGVKDRTHQAHFRCIKEADGKWHGPEAEHLADLRRQGYLNNTPEAEERAEAQRQIDQKRGVARDATCRTCRAPIGRDDKGELRRECEAGHRNGLPELAAWTARDLRRNVGRDLRGGAEGAMQIERELRREETQRLAEAVTKGFEPLVEAIKELVTPKEKK